MPPAERLVAHAKKKKGGSNAGGDNLARDRCPLHVDSDAAQQSLVSVLTFVSLTTSFNELRLCRGVMRDVLTLSLVCSSLCNDSPCANKNKGLQQNKQRPHSPRTCLRHVNTVVVCLSSAATAVCVCVVSGLTPQSGAAFSLPQPACRRNATAQYSRSLP